MYLDPGFGGMLVQALVLIVAVGGAIVFSFRKKLRQLFSRNVADTQPLENQSTATDPDDDVVDILDN